MRVRIFNLVTYLVRLPFVTVKPHVYRQDTRDGSWTIRPTLIPQLVVIAESATPEGYREEFGRRVDAIVTLGAYKSDVTDALDAATKEKSYRMAVGAAARRKALEYELRERMVFRDGVLSSWMARDIVAFAKRRIDAVAAAPYAESPSTGS